MGMLMPMFPLGTSRRFKLDCSTEQNLALRRDLRASVMQDLCWVGSAVHILMVAARRRHTRFGASEISAYEKQKRRAKRREPGLRVSWVCRRLSLYERSISMYKD